MTNSFLRGGPGRSAGLSVERVDEILAAFRISLDPEIVELCDSIGRLLVQPAIADRPIPAYDRVCMDGYALNSSVLAAGRTEFAVLGAARAGEPAKSLPKAEGCLEVMTGSVLPTGCDCVVAVERTEPVDVARMRILVPELSAGSNIHPVGRDRKAGDEVIAASTRIGPVEIAALASLGIVRPMVLRLPSIVVVSSGDELVEPSAIPLAHQIRQSNVWGIAASLEQAGFGQSEIRHVSDDPEELRQSLSKLLDDFDVLILSGGVSMGKWDLIPSALESLGVEKILHGVAQQPGLPMWVGVGKRGKLVVGLPGNPVAAMTCLARHVHPVLERAVGKRSRRTKLILAENVRRASGKTRFVPVKQDGATNFPGKAIPVKVDGSGDWAGLAGTDGFVQIDLGAEIVPEGTLVDFFPW